jgi:phosphoribosyl 1,2-cyclic phosphodiesterase
MNRTSEMKLSVLGSSSSGNGYLLHQEGEALVIEAGIRLMEVKKKLDFRIADVRACIISHGHKDHSKYIREYANAGIDVLGPAEAFSGSHNRFHPVLPGKGYKLGRFRVIPFEVPHDVTCFGYLINHPDTGRILFLTDTWLCEYTFPDLRHIIIEANYADDILEENILKGIEHPSKRDRLLTSHMELGTTKAFLKAQDLSKVQNIVLIHLSERNSDAERFQKEIATMARIQVLIAFQGFLKNLNKLQF